MKESRDLGKEIKRIRETAPIVEGFSVEDLVNMSRKYSSRDWHEMLTRDTYKGFRC